MEHSNQQKVFRNSLTSESLLVAWVIFLSVLFNFTFGALLPVIPKLSLEKAGLAFTLFYLFKAICLLPAGYVSDRLGHFTALSAAACFQALAVSSLLLFPSNPWIGRIFEGIALAQGTVSAISILRVLSASVEIFQNRIRALMSFSGVGFVFGPISAYSMMSYGVDKILDLLLFLILLSLLIQSLLNLRYRQFGAQEGVFGPSTSESSPKLGAAFLWAIIGFSAAKAASVGWQPLVAWWVTDVFSFSQVGSGMSFLVMGVMLSLGSAKPAKNWFWIFGAVGFCLMEWALRASSIAWWFALAFVGYWWGAYATVTFSKLGWNDPRKLGQNNSIWMITADLPTAFVPLLIWHWRMPWDYPRSLFGATLIALSILGYWRGIRKI